LEGLRKENVSVEHQDISWKSFHGIKNNRRKGIAQMFEKERKTTSKLEQNQYFLQS
jgi:hypothetical protein